MPICESFDAVSVVRWRARRLVWRAPLIGAVFIGGLFGATAIASDGWEMLVWLVGTVVALWVESMIGSWCRRRFLIRSESGWYAVLREPACTTSQEEICREMWERLLSPVEGNPHRVESIRRCLAWITVHQSTLSVPWCRMTVEFLCESLQGGTTSISDPEAFACLGDLRSLLLEIDRGKVSRA